MPAQLGQAIKQYASIQNEISQPHFLTFNGTPISFSMISNKPVSNAPTLAPKVPITPVPRALLPAASPPITEPSVLPKEVLQTNNNPAATEKGMVLRLNKQADY